MPSYTIVPSIPSSINSVGVHSTTPAAALQVIFLADCDYVDHVFSVTHKHSQMIYYPNNDNTFNGERPLPGNIADIQRGKPVAADTPDLIRWEAWQDLPDNSQEDYVVGEFRGDGNHVKAYINVDAASWPTGTISGNAFNDRGKSFTCRKDYGRHLYQEQGEGDIVE
ncbi:hypothetical protein HDU97_003760 [Phlyctochytrium planicorne]|nr:hypothetical protein HDU97_003760 [Phlyctochytrium planicorne]